MNQSENYPAKQTLEIPAFAETEARLETEVRWNEDELEQKAAMLIARCYQLLSEMKDKRDRMRMPS